MLVIWVSLVTQNLPAMLETWIWPLGWEDHLEKGNGQFYIYTHARTHTHTHAHTHTHTHTHTQSFCAKTCATFCPYLQNVVVPCTPVSSVGEKWHLCCFWLNFWLQLWSAESCPPPKLSMLWSPCPSTPKPTALSSNRDFTDRIQWTALRWGGYPGLSGWPNVIQISLEEGSRRVKVRERRCEDGSGFQWGDERQLLTLKVEEQVQDLRKAAAFGSWWRPGTGPVEPPGGGQSSGPALDFWASELTCNIKNDAGELSLVFCGDLEGWEMVGASRGRDICISVAESHVVQQK